MTIERKFKGLQCYSLCHKLLTFFFFLQSGLTVWIPVFAHRPSRVTCTTTLGRDIRRPLAPLHVSWTFGHFFLLFFFFSYVFLMHYCKPDECWNWSCSGISPLQHDWVAVGSVELSQSKEDPEEVQPYSTDVRSCPAKDRPKVIFSVLGGGRSQHEVSTGDDLASLLLLFLCPISFLVVERWHSDVIHLAVLYGRAV